MTWTASTDPCHARYRVYGILADEDAFECFDRLRDITDQDEDGDPSNASWTGPGGFFGYLVIDETADGGKGPLGHYRR